MNTSDFAHANNHLQRERIRRNWRQRDVAEHLGTTVVTVNRWERGIQQPGTYFRLKLCELFALTASELGLLPEEESTHNGQSNETVAREHVSVKQGYTHRHRMLLKVHSMWIKGVLEPTFSGKNFLMPLLQGRDEAVTSSVHPGKSLSRTIIPGTHITEVYDTAAGELLILGEPGSGKTTLLLELTRDLLDRAFQDEEHPIPVIFPLSSWPEKQQSLAQWLHEELQRVYLVSRETSREWIKHNQILPLLDGLDEAPLIHRAACVQAINVYRRGRGLLPFVVCSRNSEYLAQSQRLLLQYAVAVQPQRELSPSFLA